MGHAVAGSTDMKWEWEQVNKFEWRADGPNGGARILRHTQPRERFSVYREGKYLGSDNSLDAAQQRAESNTFASREVREDEPEPIKPTKTRAVPTEEMKPVKGNHIEIVNTAPYRPGSKR